MTDIKSDTKEIQRIIRMYLKIPTNSTKLQIVKWMNFFNTDHYSKLNQDEMSKLNSPITYSEINPVNVKCLKTPKAQDQMGLIENSNRLSKKNSCKLFKLFHKIEKNNISQFNMFTFTLLPKPHKESTKKDCRPISILKVFAKILTKILTRWI